MAEHRLTHFREVQTDPATNPAATVERSPDGRWYTVSGACPTCHGRTVSRVAHGVLGPGKGLWGARPSPPPLTGVLTVYCMCGFPHPARPDSSPDTGCGAFWDVPVPDPGGAQP
ncbi:hypothetical protein [Streptacidiphilus jiangxiensis]|uniref:Uncharacterized protein n=1 Tax=Streptacidiphilus jiangxiensis TaxID=235985 RepID=A0A1H7GAW0_STRJI|nr:hypothetical protein [Streptacidiphilus jiangxiensis]SEK35426.1 hypothetical protein SAMN05414137_101623 [Streptacidiphilus jiangxiensis]